VEIDEPRYHRILVALDSSESATFALRHVVAHAQRYHGRLTLLTVAPRTPAIVARAGLSPEQLAQEIDDDAAKDLRAVAAALPEDISVTTLLRHGDPVAEILAQLAEEHYDLLAMGARGRGRMTSALLGSVSAGVLHRSPVPVIVFHAPTIAA
jgi:universal stress protein A